MFTVFAAFKFGLKIRCKLDFCPLDNYQKQFSQPQQRCFYMLDTFCSYSQENKQVCLFFFPSTSQRCCNLSGVLSRTDGSVACARVCGQSCWEAQPDMLETRHLCKCSVSQSARGEASLLQLGEQAPLLHPPLKTRI